MWFTPISEETTARHQRLFLKTEKACIKYKELVLSANNTIEILMWLDINDS